MTSSCNRPQSSRRATITGLVPVGTRLENIKEVEVEVYHVFPLDSAIPPSGKVPSRVNSPSDVEIDSATRAGSFWNAHVLRKRAECELSRVGNTVVNGIIKFPTCHLPAAKVQRRARRWRSRSRSRARSFCRRVTISSARRSC